MPIFQGDRMKKNKHPAYQKVLFRDSSTNKEAVFSTTMQSNEKVMHNGEELPLICLPVSSSSHQFYVGGQQNMDTEGRIKRFTKRYAEAQEQLKAQQEKALQAKAPKAAAEIMKKKKNSK